MKRFKKRFAALCLAAATLFAVAIGAGLPRIQNYSADVVARLFPVTYRITYRSAKAQPVTAPVRFTADSAIVTASSGDTVVPLSDAVFVCLQNELRAQNMLRSGLLTAVVILAAALLPIALSAAAFAAAPLWVRSNAKRRMQATPRRPATHTHTPTMPSAA